MSFRSKKGFSLVELIVVIAILGVIVAIAVPAVNGALSASSVKADYISAANIASSVRVWLTDATSTQYAARTKTIGNKWVELSKIGNDLDDKTDINKVPEGLRDGKYFVRWAESSDKIVILIDSETPGTDYTIPENAYNYDITTENGITAGVVYIENVVVEQDTDISEDLWK